MVERTRQDSTRDLLEELEDGWATSPASTPLAKAAAPAASVDADAGGFLPSPSTPDVDALDEGWLDDLFPGEDGGNDEDGEDDEDDEPEPELPDERLDPEAFALAKKARDERAAKQKEKKRAKAELKRARQKARAAAMRQKQKSKKARAALASRPKPEPAPKKKPARAKASEPNVALDTNDVDDASDVPAARRPASSPRAKATAARGTPSTMASVKLLAIVLAVLVALAAAAAAIMK